MRFSWCNCENWHIVRYVVTVHATHVAFYSLFVVQVEFISLWTSIWIADAATNTNDIAFLFGSLLTQLIVRRWKRCDHCHHCVLRTSLPQVDKTVRSWRFCEISKSFHRALTSTWPQRPNVSCAAARCAATLCDALCAPCAAIHFHVHLHLWFSWPHVIPIRQTASFSVFVVITKL